MSTLHAHAKPGDTIEITYNGIQWFEKRFVVVELPNGVTGYYLKGDAWCSLPDGSTRMFAACQYKIVHKIVDHGHGDELSVDESLAKQRDDNLQSIFV